MNCHKWSKKCSWTNCLFYYCYYHYYCYCYRYCCFFPMKWNLNVLFTQTFPFRFQLDSYLPTTNVLHNNSYRSLRIMLIYPKVTYLEKLMNRKSFYICRYIQAFGNDGRCFLKSWKHQFHPKYWTHLGNINLILSIGRILKIFSWADRKSKWQDHKWCPFRRFN